MAGSLDCSYPALLQSGPDRIAFVISGLGLARHPENAISFKMPFCQTPRPPLVSVLSLCLEGLCTGNPELAAPKPRKMLRPAGVQHKCEWNFQAFRINDLGLGFGKARQTMAAEHVRNYICGQRSTFAEFAYVINSNFVQTSNKENQGLETNPWWTTRFQIY